MLDDRMLAALPGLTGEWAISAMVIHLTFLAAWTMALRFDETDSRLR